jgi:energy-coupling factor transporter ATP-binding protein EcfA2
MKIHELTVENFRGIEKRRIDFCEPTTGLPRRLSVLVGPNTCGKTTVLDAVHLAFEAFSNLKEPRLRPDLSAHDPALRPDPVLPIRIGLKFSLQPDELTAIAELQQQLGDPPSAPTSDVYEIRMRWPPKGDVPEIANVLEEASPWGANFLLRGRAYARVAKKNRLASEEVFGRVGGVLYLDQHRGVELAVPSTRTAPEDELRENARSRDVLPWLELQSRLDQKWDPATQGKSAWSRVKDWFAMLAAPSSIDDMKAFDDGFDLRFRRAGRFYYTAGLSYGEAQMLRLATNLAAFPAARSVVLIDEVELHQHPAWQRRLLHFMRKGGGDDNQFIVSTHSETLASYLHPDEVIRLGELDDDG